ncbi:M56 family metallopeptidase [Dyadobacter sp. CY343]|uniref:M56 family metallopeptidase n=1 Tax=Dyadobacter sp. CY343 TaxID=2907299 RepID=UPI001F15A60B|nr:M56 family metallopeptidase [Dyadobacter sp. CY343]MCE7059996.1 M48 family metalloprotease [Dyadobacter sp. CY343]
MDLSIWNQAFVEKFVQSVCLTLMHSVWQGLIVAVLAGLMLVFTRKARPALRYNLLAGLLLGFILISGATFWIEIMRNSTVGIPDANGFVGEGSQPVFFYNTSSGSFESSVREFWVKPVIGFCTKNAALIVTFWLLIFILKSATAASGLIYLRKIKTQRVSEPDVQWKKRLHELCGMLGVYQSVQLLESALVKVPMVTGYIKPMILLPVGMLCKLTTSQVEAILLHELAHIKRRDYLVNLVQTFCENVFFFNPALLWLSSLIREEREHCCDDLAISVMRDSKSFVQALVSFQEYNLKGSGMELTFSRKRNHLMDRIKRIIYQNNKQLNAMEKLFVTLSLVAVTAFSAAMTKTETHWKPAIPRQTVAPAAAPAPLSNVAKAPVYKLDTLPKKKRKAQSGSTIHSANIYSEQHNVGTYHVTSDGKEYMIIKKDGKLVSLVIDGKEIPKEQYAAHETTLDQIEKEIKIAHEKAEIERKKADEMRAKADIERAKADKQREEADVQRQEADVRRQAAEEQRKQADRQRAQGDEMRKEAEKMRELANLKRIEADKERERADEQRKLAEKNREEYEKERSSRIK